MKARTLAAELTRMFPLSWALSREYALPQGRLGEPYYIKWNSGPKPRGEGWDTAGRFTDDGAFIMGSFRNPVHVAQVALHAYDRAYEGSAPDRRRFLAQADWFVRAQEDAGAYRYVEPEPLYSAPSGWISAMAQGQAASVLIRAYALTRNEEYLAAGERALSPLFSPIERGGASYIANGDLFFEEAAVEPACHILNGHLYAAFAVWEYARYVNADRYGALHRDALGTLERWLPAYDINGWSCYDLAVDSAGRRHLAPLWYHHFHIAQLRVFAAMTSNAPFRQRAERWNDALARTPVRAQLWSYHAQSVFRGIARRIAREGVRPLQPLPAFTAGAARKS